MKVIEEWIDFKSRYSCLAILIALFEPLKRLVLVTKSHTQVQGQIAASRSA